MQENCCAFKASNSKQNKKDCLRAWTVFIFNIQFYFEKGNQCCVTGWPLSKLPFQNILSTAGHSLPTVPSPTYFSSLSLSSTVSELSLLACLVPNHQARSRPALAKLIVPVLRAKHLSFCHNRHHSVQNSSLWILSDRPWGFTYCASHRRGYLIVPICTEAAPWISLFSQNSVIGFFYLLTIN